MSDVRSGPSRLVPASRRFRARARHTAVCCLALVTIVVADVAAHAPPDTTPSRGLWSLEVPGGVAPLLRAARLDPSLPRSRALREVIRVIYDAPLGVNHDADVRRSWFLDYLQAVSAFESIATQAGGTYPPVPTAGQTRTSFVPLVQLARVLGCDTVGHGTAQQLVLGTSDTHTRRRQWLIDAGVDVDAIVTGINAGRPQSLHLARDLVPLPIPAACWDTIMPASDDYGGSLATNLLGRRRAALLYVGLLGLDAETRTWLSERPSLVKALMLPTRAAVLASIGTSIRITAGRVEVPGGPSAESAWEALVGTSPSRPQKYLLALLDHDHGRAALLHHTLTHASARARTFVLGPPTMPPSARADALAGVYAAAAQALNAWTPHEYPFARSRFDLAHLLTVTPLRPDATVAALDSRRFWTSVFEAETIPRRIDAPGVFPGDAPLDATGIVGILAGPPARWGRGPAWAFAQRTFVDAPRPSWADAWYTVRAYGRYRVLIHAMERMGITAPDVYASAIECAERIGRVTDPRRARVAIAIYQGSLALVERARLGRALDAADATAAIRSLSQLPIETHLAAGAWYEWLRASVFTVGERARATPVPSEGLASIESHVLAAMAGRQLTSAHTRTLEITLEGVLYRVDPAAATLARLQAVRRRQMGVPLDAVETFGRAIATTAGTLPDRAASPATIALLRETIDAISGHRIPTPHDMIEGTGAEVIQDAVVSFADAKTSANRRHEAIIGLEQVHAAYLAASLVSLVYAPWVGRPDGPALLAGDPAGRHDWGLAQMQQDGPVPYAWRLPVEDRSGDGWHLSGALVGIDLALGRQSLRRVVDDRIPGPPSISDVDAQGLCDAAVGSVPFDLVDADLATIVEALHRGRQRLAAARAGELAWVPVAADAGITDVRQHTLAWALRFDPEHVDDQISRVELLRLGLVGAPPQHLDAWGTSGRLVDGRWSLRFPLEPSVELAQGRRGLLVASAFVADTTLVVAEAVYARHLPAVLLPGMLAAYTQDVIDDTRMACEEDWHALAVTASTLGNRLDDAIAALTLDGPLVAIAR